MLQSPFKRNRNKSFSFTPRYYNEEKEALEKRFKQIEVELKGNKVYDSAIFGRSLKEQWKQNKNTSNFSKKSNVRLLVILFFLFAIAYYIIYS